MMTLAEFVKELWEQGTITVTPQPMSATDEDQPATLALLRRCYHEDARHQPAPVPAFDPEAALWAARYLYRAAQLTLLRDLDDTAVHVWLQEYVGVQTSGAHYSADLVLRHLPGLLQLSKGLAPADVLVQRLEDTLRRWPLSAVGAPLRDEDPGPVLAHAGLRILYADRLLAARDLTRARHPATRELLREVLGSYAAALWPEFQGLPELAA